MPNRIIVVLMLIGLVLILAETAKAKPPIPCKRLDTTKKAHERAQRGWNSETLKKDQGAIDRVRRQKWCVPQGEPRRFVEAAIEKAQKQYRKAKTASEWPTPESVGVSTATLEAIAACESEGDPTVDDASGTYHGKYQFDLGTWASVGGSGDPHLASEDEQDYRAALLYAQSGSSPWPVCG